MSRQPNRSHRSNCSSRSSRRSRRSVSGWRSLLSRSTSPSHLAGRSSSLARVARLAFATLAVLGFASFLAPTTAHAQDHYTFTVILQTGVGGSIDEDDAGLDNSSFQAGFALVSTDVLQVGGRFGQIDFDDSASFGGAPGVTLDYVTAGAEYTFDEGFYTSGIYLGLGYYQIESDAPPEFEVDENSIGFALGVTGEFEITRKVGFKVEVTAHVTDLSVTQIFATGHAGIALHF